MSIRAPKPGTTSRPALSPISDLDWTLNEYQTEALRTAAPDGISPVIAALGLAGEAGEFADHVKKVVAQGHEYDGEKMVEELGDVLWYVALGAQALGLTLDDIGRINVAKLRARYPKGFDTELSVNRVA